MILTRHYARNQLTYAHLVANSSQHLSLTHLRQALPCPLIIRYLTQIFSNNSLTNLSIAKLVSITPARRRIRVWNAKDQKYICGWQFQGSARNLIQRTLVCMWRHKISATSPRGNVQSEDFFTVVPAVFSGPANLIGRR